MLIIIPKERFSGHQNQMYWIIVFFCNMATRYDKLRVQQRGTSKICSFSTYHKLVIRLTSPQMMIMSLVPKELFVCSDNGGLAKRLRNYIEPNVNYVVKWHTYFWHYYFYNLTMSRKFKFRNVLTVKQNICQRYWWNLAEWSRHFHNIRGGWSNIPPNQIIITSDFSIYWEHHTD